MQQSAAITETRRRDAGLLRGIGVLALTASVVNSVLGAGIFTMPAAVVRDAGTLAPLAYLASALIMAGVVICFAEAGSRVPTSGGAYGTVEAAFGPGPGFITGFLLTLSNYLASAGLAAAVADILGGVAPALQAGPARAGVLFLLYAVMAAGNLVGVRMTARLISAGTLIKLVPLLTFTAIGLASFLLPAHAVPALPHAAQGGFGRAMILATFAFMGMETAVMASGEVRDPNRTVPRALFFGMAFILALYVAIQLGAQHLMGGALAGSSAPLADAVAVVQPRLRGLLLAGAGLSMFVYLTNDILGTSRMLFALARDGRLPAWLGALNSRHLPAHAIVSYAAAAFALAMSGSFEELVVLAALTEAGVYLLNCAAALRLYLTRVALAGTPLGFRALPAAAVLGMAGMALLMLLAKPAEQMGLAAAIALAGVIFAVTEILRRRAAR